ncbi:hypothetical protein [Paeniglutamicibacter cryotolerans]|uniref:DUF8175 domain-containing protein n=1 Tax=Paeniglutamicibacter cryotolerans TaxID=670079 RepID=A0A839QRZ7_9MICC|nr:hypothetical protein [Paeniglutamicibacter cryotolerans]MBB2997554.1 hypothetical protein [Paeniglutamicibacter cryotolerans]
MSSLKNPRQLSARWNKITLWISVLILALIAGMAIILLTTPTKPAPLLTDTPSTATSGPATQEGCNVPVGDTSATPKMPSDLRWEARDGWTWPVSDTYGPTQMKDGFGVCFARSPLGAALLAVSFNSTGNILDEKQALELYLADSPGKDIQMSKPLTGQISPISYSGFIVDSFTPNHAQVTLVFSTPDTATSFTGLPLSFRWVNGDWKQEVLDDGSLFRGQPIAPQRGDFVEWGDSGA